MELSEIREIVKNGTNEKDKMLLNAIISIGYSKEEAEEILAISFKQFTDLLFLQISAIPVGMDQEAKANMLHNYFEDMDIDPIDIIGKVANNYKHLKATRKKIEETYKKTNSWGAVFSTCVYLDDPEANESFIDYIEEVNNTKVKDAKHLQELTGITNINIYMNKGEELTEEEAEKLAKESNKPLEDYQGTPKQCQEEALKQLDETLQASKYSKYTKALDMTIETGGKYKDLLAIDPKNYGLPKSWDIPGCLGNNIESSILWAIKMSLLDSSGGLYFHPGLREIAKELEAPYSVIMGAYKLLN